MPGWKLAGLRLSFPVEAVIFDVGFILFARFFLSGLSGLLAENLLLATAVALPLQWVALYAATCTVFMKEHTAPEGWQRGMGAKIWWTALFYVTLFGFAWLIPPVTALERAGVLRPNIVEIAGGLGFLINGVLSSLALHFAFETSKRERVVASIPLRYLTACIVMLYLAFFASLLQAALHALAPSVTPLQHTLLLLIGVLSFLPVRLLLLLRPPYHILELASFLAAFAVFLGSVL
jgi:hypothetical protein